MRLASLLISSAISFMTSTLAAGVAALYLGSNSLMISLYSAMDLVWSGPGMVDGRERRPYLARR